VTDIGAFYLTRFPLIVHRARPHGRSCDKTARVQYDSATFAGPSRFVRMYGIRYAAEDGLTRTRRNRSRIDTP
jgi:hypothetical protein